MGDTQSSAAFKDQLENLQTKVDKIMRHSVKTSFDVGNASNTYNNNNNGGGGQRFSQDLTTENPFLMRNLNKIELTIETLQNDMKNMSRDHKKKFEFMKADIEAELETLRLTKERVQIVIKPKNKCTQSLLCSLLCAFSIFLIFRKTQK